MGTPVARAKAFQGSAPSLQQPAGEPARGHQQVPAMHLGQSAHLGLLEGWRGVRRHAAAAAALSGPALKEGKGLMQSRPIKGHHGRYVTDNGWNGCSRAGDLALHSHPDENPEMTESGTTLG